MPDEPLTPVEESRAATGQMFVSFRSGYYQGYYTSSQATHKMPKGNPGDKGYVASFIPDPDSAVQSADGSLKLIAIPINMLTEEDIEELKLNHPNVDELTHDEYKALL